VVQAHVSVSRHRTIAGLSAGGFGAVGIALRHPRLFRRVESWGGREARSLGAAAGRRPAVGLRPGV